MPEESVRVDKFHASDSVSCERLCCGATDAAAAHDHDAVGGELLDRPLASQLCQANNFWLDLDSERFHTIAPDGPARKLRGTGLHQFWWKIGVVSDDHAKVVAGVGNARHQLPEILEAYGDIGAPGQEEMVKMGVVRCHPDPLSCMVGVA